MSFQTPDCENILDSNQETETETSNPASLDPPLEIRTLGPLSHETNSSDESASGDNEQREQPLSSDEIPLKTEPDGDTKKLPPDSRRLPDDSGNTDTVDSSNERTECSTQGTLNDPSVGEKSSFPQTILKEKRRSSVSQPSQGSPDHSDEKAEDLVEYRAQKSIQELKDTEQKPTLAAGKTISFMLHPNNLFHAGFSII